MSITESIPVSYFLKATHAPAGVEVMVLHGDREAPVYWKDGQSYFTLRLHQDGSLCTSSCECVTETNHWLYDGQSNTVGEWTWNGNRSYAIGWHRNGASVAERALEARVDELAEELAQEKILHGLTREDRADCERGIEVLQERRGKLRESLRRHRQAAAEAERRFGLAFQAAWAGWSVAILIAAIWVGSVIA